jgi:hypothetical protein
LIRANNLRQDSFKSISQGFCNNFQDKIAQGYRSVVTSRYGVSLLWD